ncbi:Serine/threonine-protein kinase [Rhynchospora pubera]|uniref:Receptor-like serine/threonine-protein kinase n=1 Tax=Rhynchospora pubera TaxID=906938 RepID=A0AAV8HEQ6_9POAL|nr:Serine/threonine-protein kinase [Rhynchospora pubera]
MNKWQLAPLLPLLLLTFFPLLSPSLSTDTITIGSPLSYPDTLVSSNNTFALGFFNTGNSSRWYLGIWYTITPHTVVWVANRKNPMPDSNGSLYINSDSPNLQLKTNSSDVLWHASSSSMVNPIARLSEEGNFVLKDKNANNIAWQSFDNPTDTLLPGMPFGLIAGQNLNLTSWTDSDNPAPSHYTLKLDQTAWPEIIIWNGSKPIFRTGPLDGTKFSGSPKFNDYTEWTFEYVSNQTGEYIYYMPTSSSKLRLVLNHSTLQMYRFDDAEAEQEWDTDWLVPDPNDPCDKYARCGQFGLCNLTSSNKCSCLEGFEPTHVGDWYVNETTQGCRRGAELNCTSDGFLSISNVKLPDTTNTTVDRTIKQKECRKRCLKNCSCYAYSNMNEDRGCTMWMGDFTDIRKLDHGGFTLYYRVARSELHGTDAKKKTAVIATSVILGLLFLASVAYLVHKKFKQKAELLAYSERHSQASQESSQTMSMIRNEILEEGSRKGNAFNLPIVDVDVVLAATGNFALENKLGEGGFGTVFRGRLEGGERIAVKRLSYSSTQGLSEFKNEVILIAELQHINLVQLLGCCISGEERMLIYEYMENKSLDTIIFDKSKSSQLNWPKRFEIIMGIARGILYLHQDSRLRIIHRDLKASNVLLDENMNPKISDFGIARIFGRHDNDSVTNRVVGTYGYMSPEYAMYGVFSIKSDVFSFGVLVLEIISGKKCSEIFAVEPKLNLLSYTWALWNDGNVLNLLDSSISRNSNDESEIIRCIQVGLLCAQDRPQDRPHMSEAILMLNSRNMILPLPKQPGYIGDRFINNMESSTSYMSHDTSITTLLPR